MSDENRKKSRYGLSINTHNLSNDNIFDKNKNDLMSTRNECNKIEEYLKTELDNMYYDDAVKKDNRAFCEYLCEKVKINQIILTTFFAVDNLIPRTIKIMLFILDIDLYLFVNGLFFNEEYVSEIFHLTEPDNFFSFIPRSINRFFYTTLVGVIIRYVIDFFFIEEKKIKSIFKREKDNIIVLKYEISQIIKNIQSRNTYFIILSFVVIIFTWYYVFCFNNIYPHMRNEWIKSNIIIILVMQMLSLLSCLLQAIFRFISFRCKSEKIYKISLLFS